MYGVRASRHVITGRIWREHQQVSNSIQTKDHLLIKDFSIFSICLNQAPFVEFVVIFLEGIRGLHSIIFFGQISRYPIRLLCGSLVILPGHGNYNGRITNHHNELRIDSRVLFNRLFYTYDEIVPRKNFRG